MRKIVLFIIAVLMVSLPLAAEAQKPKTVPKPLIAATDFVDDDGWTEYISNEGKFNVLLPSKPERKSQTMDSLLGKKQLITYTSSVENIVYVVGYLDFKIPINDEASLRRIYDGWQKGVTSVYPNGELEEKDTTFDGRLAREVTYVAGVMSIRAKAFFTKGKLFQMMTFHVLEGDDALLREVSITKDKFFNSLKLETPPVDTKNTGLTGAVNARLYQNNYFNFSLALPKDWIVISQEDTNLMKEGSKDRTTSQQGRRNVETALKKTTFMFNLSKNEIGSLDNASIISAAETAPPVKATLAQIAVATAANFVTKSGYTMDGAIAYPKIDSMTFAVISLRKKDILGNPLFQRFYIGRSKGYLLEFLVTYTKTEDLETFEAMMKTLKFSRAK